jgi:acyl-CoA thioesterase YciA
MILLATHTVKRSDLGLHDNLFGGQLLMWLDEAAAAYAMEFCHNRRMVTLRMDECLFKKPAKEGSLVKIYGVVTGIGTTSCTIYTEARRLNVYTHEEDVILHTNFVFVRIDEEGTSIPISDKVRNEFNNKNEKKNKI